MKKWYSILLAMICATSAQAQTAQVLFSQNFDSPTGYTDIDQLSWSYQSVNELFGAEFQNTFDVETLQIAGSAKFSDPSGTGGAYALGMLDDAEPDLLAAVFDVENFGFLNIRMDISSIDFDCCGGPFNLDGEIPTFRISLYDAPLGAFDVGAISSEPLATETITGVASAPQTFEWTQHVIALDASGSTDGTVAMVIDLIEGGYAAFDNVTVASSDIRGDVGTTSSGSSGGGGVSLILLVLGLPLVLRRKHDIPCGRPSFFKRQKTKQKVFCE